MVERVRGPSEAPHPTISEQQRGSQKGVGADEPPPPFFSSCHSR